MVFMAAIVAVVALAIAAQLWSRNRKMRRETYIRSFILPSGLFQQLQLKHPQLTTKDCQLVAQGLRQFFLAYHHSGYKMISMPSQVVDDLWHTLILYTRNYQRFCDEAFGRFLHHSPAIVLGGVAEGNAGLRRCWWFACKQENINPKQPLRLPLLFALDAKLQIVNGFHYATDCKGLRNPHLDTSGGTSPYCGGDFANPGAAGSSDGFGDTDAGGGSAGDGGGGDGGGCGGGE